MKDPIPTFAALTSELKKRFPDLAYLQVTEARFDDRVDKSEVRQDTRNDFLRDLWAPKPYISTGAATFKTGIENAEKKGDVIAYGRYYLANVSIHYISQFSTSSTDDFLLSLTCIIVLRRTFP